MRDLPAGKAEEVRKRLRRERAMREGGIERGGEKGLVGKLWMGGEEEGWKERRLREEREALEEGRGYGGLIMDQIWEVWNWGRGREMDGEVEERRGTGGSGGEEGKGDDVVGGKGGC